MFYCVNVINCVLHVDFKRASSVMVVMIYGRPALRRDVLNGLVLAPVNVVWMTSTAAEDLLQVLANDVKRSQPIISDDGASQMVHQELVKVPTEVIGPQWLPEDIGDILNFVHHLRGGVLEILEERVCFISIHIHLGENGEVGHKSTSRPHMFDAVQDLIVISWLLQAELIGGEGQDSESEASEVAHECIQQRILLWRLASEGCHVRDQRELPAILPQGHAAALQGLAGEVVDGSPIRRVTQ